MADISQVKLPNGDTFDLVDEKSGYGKVHMVPAENLGDDSSIEATYAEIVDWIENEDIVIIVDYNGERYYLYDYNGYESIFYSPVGHKFVYGISTPPTFEDNSWLTLSTLPIYDGTVV